jgi:hypothetical protein
VTRAQWGAAIPVDSGKHVIEATAKDKLPYRTTVEITKEGSTTTVTLPALEAAPPMPGDLPPTPAPSEGGGSGGGSTLRIIGIGTAILGAGLIGTGAVFAASSSSKKDDLESHARAGGAWGPEQSATFDDGESAATLANVFFVTGAVVLVTGGVLTVLGFTSKKSGSSTASAMPTMGGLRCAF